MVGWKLKLSDRAIIQTTKELANTYHDFVVMLRGDNFIIGGRLADMEGKGCGASITQCASLQQTVHVAEQMHKAHIIGR